MRSAADPRPRPARALRLALALGLGMLLAAPASAAAVAAPPEPRTAAVEEGYERVECAVSLPTLLAQRVQCGILTVPESRAEGADPARTIDLPVAVIDARDARPVPDPLVIAVADGPHGEQWSALQRFLANRLGDDRRIVLVGVRGGVLADPTIDCEELGTAALAADGRLDPSASDIVAAVSACRERLDAAGVDRTAYTLPAAAADFAALRAELGYDQWNLYGFAEASRLALTVLRDQPAGLRSVILDAPQPPNADDAALAPGAFTAALAGVQVACRAEADCRDRHGSLTRDLDRALDRLEQEPVDVTVRTDGGAVTVAVDDAVLVQVVSHALASPQLYRALPFALDRVAKGDVGAIRPMLRSAVEARSAASEGLALATACSAEIPYSTDEAVDAALAENPRYRPAADLELWREVCAAWEMPTLGEIENAAVASEVPTLLLVGERDPFVSTAAVDAAASGLARHFRFVVPGVGHGALQGQPVDSCALTIARQFLTTPTADLQPQCTARTEPAGFFTTAGVHPTPAIYELNGDARTSPIGTGLAVTLVVALVAIFLYALVYGLRWLASRNGEAPPGAMLAAGTAAGLNLAYIGGMVLVAVNTERLVLDYGIPAAAWPLVILPWAAVAATALLAALIVRAWILGDGAVVHRVLLSLATLVCFGFAALLLVRGLLTL